MYNPHREMIIIFFFPFFLSFFLIKIKEEERHCQLSCWLPTGDETIGEGKETKEEHFYFTTPSTTANRNDKYYRKRGKSYI